jgi:hypothetical protein
MTITAMWTTAACLRLGVGEVVARSDAVEVGEGILERPLVQLQPSPCCDKHGTSCAACKPRP